MRFFKHNLKKTTQRLAEIYGQAAKVELNNSTCYFAARTFRPLGLNGYTEIGTKL